MRKQKRDPGIMDSSNLTDTEFKTQVIKILDEIRGSVDEFRENFKKEMENIKMEIEIIKGKQK